MGVADYKDLRLYQLAFESAMQIFELTRTFPVEEREYFVEASFCQRPASRNEAPQ
jgi:hypothetical protein